MEESTKIADEERVRSVLTEKHEENVSRLYYTFTEPSF